MLSSKRQADQYQCQQALLIAQRYSEAKQLLESDPVLLWLIAAAAKKQQWSDENYRHCFSLSRLDILALLGFPARKMALKMLRKLSACRFDFSVYYNINYWLHSHNLQALNHYPKLSLNHIKLFRSCPEMIGTRWTVDRFDEIERLNNIQAVIEQVNASLRKAKQINLPSYALKHLKKLHSIECLETLHENLNKFLKIRFLAKKNIAYAKYPLAGNQFIMPIKNSSMLVNESLDQINCSWSYHEQLLESEYFIYKVTFPERATLGLVIDEEGCLKVDQLFLKRNEEVSEQTKAFINDWLTK